MNLKIKSLVLILLIMLLQPQVFSQTRAVRKAEKAKENLKRDYNKARKKEIKRRFEIQTDETKEQMKESHQRAKYHNKSVMKETSFLRKLFKKKKYKK